VVKGKFTPRSRKVAGSKSLGLKLSKLRGVLALTGAIVLGFGKKTCNDK
jgi:hypothetical protein